MPLDKIVLIFLPIFILINFFFIKYLPKFFLARVNDSEFSKPQSFHDISTPRIGGLLILFLSTIFIIFNFFYIKDIFFFKFIIFSAPFFFLGFLADLRVQIKPHIRLFFIVVISLLLVSYFDIKIFSSQIEILDNLLKNYEIFSIIFVCLCIIFICNGSNFIDGFNGLLIIHAIIIFIILYFVNALNSNNYHINNLILLLIIICTSVLFFNFPKAKIFLGDGGSYFLGVMISLTVIETSNLNKMISPFFFAGILFYIFFEVFFSFFRKFFFNNLSPLKPDKNHLHMLFFKKLNYNFNNLEKSNYFTGLIINIIYFILILPLLFNYKNTVFCKIYFFLLLIIYLLLYVYLKQINLKKK